MIDWAVVEDAIQTFVKTASGINGKRVIWKDQNGFRPGQAPPTEGVFITLLIGPQVPVGLPYVTKTFDEDAALGEEITVTANVLKSFTVSVQAFGSETVGANSALALLSMVQAKLALPTLRNALRAVGLSPYDQGTITNLTEFFATAAESRAAVTISFYVLESVTELEGYIDTVEVTDTTTDQTFVGVLSMALGGTAVVALGVAAGADAVIVSQTSHDAAGKVTFTAGTDAETDGLVLMTITFSRTMVFFIMELNNANEAAIEESVAEQCFIIGTAGNTATIRIDNVGCPLVSGRQYALSWTTKY